MVVLSYHRPNICTLFGSLSSMSKYAGVNARVPEDDLQKLEDWSLTKQRFVCPLHNLIDSSKQLRNSFCSCRWPLLFHSSIFQHPDASLNHSNSLFKPWKRHGHLLRLTLGILNSFKGAVLSKFNEISERQLLIVGGVQQIKKSSPSYVRICVLGLMYWVGPRWKCGAT